uniref:non-specific serine/threonine protein kinase n=1 Tax=Kalanchoe fedtschenkoi TaxID=63787 RepID=A0A7N0VJH6_KALFE
MKKTANRAVGSPAKLQRNGRENLLCFLLLCLFYIRRKIVTIFVTLSSTASFQVSVYAYVQCTPDLNGSSCGGCLDSLIKFYTDASIQSYGATIVCPSCQMRFESYQFYEIAADQPPPSSSPPPVPNGNGKSKTRNVLIAVVLAVSLACWVNLRPVTGPSLKPTIAIRRNEANNVFLVKHRSNMAIAAAGAYIFLRRWNRRKKPGAEDIESVECVEYDFETIKAATGNFSDGNKVGQGGFGAVYKGRLTNGQEIAVKRLEASSGQGDLEFKNEVILAAELQHRNLVKLLGFCLEGRERLLVYELLSASLDQFIFDGEKCRYLDWERRYKIIGGVAKGLQYLHEDSRLSIIHLDLKASNVLLDEEMNPKIADFGMARLFLLNQTRGKTSTHNGNLVSA